MGIPEYCKKLVKATKSKNKSELEIYRNVSKNVEEILVNDLEHDKCLLLKSLIAYFEGKSANSWYLGIIQIAYAITIGCFCLLPDVTDLSRHDADIIMLVLSCLSVIVVIVAIFSPDFSRKMVICVLNDKLNEMSASQNNIDISLEINDNTSNSKCKNKKSKKHKKHKK